MRDLTWSRYSVRVTLIIGLIFSLACGGRQLLRAARTLLTGNAPSLFLYGAFACFSALLLSQRRDARPPTLFFFLTLFIGVGSTLFFDIPEERAHLLLFGTLGFVSTTLESKRAITRGCLIVVVVSIADELLQAVLPYRVGDIRDVLFNMLGGLWGITLRVSRDCSFPPLARAS